MDVWVSGRMDGWNGWMYGWLDVCVCSLLVVVVLLSLWRGLNSRKFFYRQGASGVA